MGRVLKFHCLGPASGSCKNFHEDGFLRKSNDFSPGNKESDILLFGKNFLFHSALVDKKQFLFECSRKAFLLLHGQLTTRGLRAAADDLSVHLRNNVVQFFNYILAFINKCLPDLDNAYAFILRLEKELWLLRILYHKLSFARLPDHALAFYASTLGNESFSPALHLVHCHLDVRWLFIKIIDALDKVKEKLSDFFQCSQVAKSSCLCVEEEILLLMNELVWMAIVRYEKADKSELASFSAFSCVCVKEMWLLLMHYPYTSQDFWSYFHQTIRVVLDNKEPATDTYRSSLKIAPSDFLPCSNRNEFGLWFLADLARLLEYSPQGEYVGSNCSANDKFDVLDDIIRGLLTEGEGPSEVTMRNIIPLISKIQATCGHVRSGPIMLLWEYFFKKINSTFYIPGSKLNSNIVLSKSGLALLQDVKFRLDGSVRDKRENSYLMFLRLLGEHLLACQRNGIPASRLISRVFLKFSSSRPEKLKDFLEQGIFHLSSLYLTLALGSNTGSIVTRLVELLAAIPKVDGMKDAKHEMIFKSYSASLLALEEMHVDLTDAADAIIQHVDWCLGQPCLPPLMHLIDALKILYQRDVAVTKGLHNLLTAWIPTYLTVCKKTDIVRFLAIFIPLLDQLKACLTNGTTETQHLRSRVEHFVIPTLTEHESLTTAELAGLCSIISPKYKQDIFRHWSNNEDSSLSGKFLSTIVEKSGPDANALFPLLESFVRQAWVRCCFMWGANKDTRSLARFIGTCSNSSSLRLDWTSPEPFKSFVQYFGEEYSMCQTLNDKSTLRSCFLSFFPKFDKWLENQCRTLEQLDAESAPFFYENAADLFSRCPQLIYTKSDPRCLLKVMIDLLVLPRSMYKPEYKPPLHVHAVLKRCLARFLDGLLALDPERDAYVGRLVRDVVTQYLTRLQDEPADSHPLLTVLSQSVHSSYLTSILCGFLLIKDGSLQPFTSIVLKLLRSLVATQCPTSEIAFDGTAEVVLEIVISLENYHPVKDLALDFFYFALKSSRNRRRMMPLMSDACKRLIAFNAGAWFDAVSKLAPLCRTELEPLVPIVKEAILDIEKQSGVDNDVSLRRMLQTLELAIG